MNTPWKIDASPIDANYCVRDAKNNMVCENIEYVDYAKLLAAAPDIKDALDGLVHYANLHVIEPEAGWGSFVAAAIIDARAAIARATA